MMHAFADRAEAGRLLADELSEVAALQPIVLAIPRGGVEVGAALAAAIGSELDVVLARKLRAPFQPELAIGAVSEDGSMQLVPGWETVPGVTTSMIDEERTIQLREMDRRRILFRGENRKNKTRDLERQITAELADMLAEHRGPDDALVWPWDRRSRSQWASLQVLCRTAGVKYRGFHGFRRTAASYAALMGGRAAATRLLDHSDPNLQAVYVDSLICPDEGSSCAALPPLDLEDRPPGPPAPAA